MKRLRSHIAALLLCLGPAAAQAAPDAYPAKPITIVYPYAPGSASDTLTRLIAESLQKQLGQPVIVESRPGAGGSIATEHVVRAAPAVNDLMGGHIDSMMDNAASQIPYVSAGKTTALFVTSDYRFDGYPKVPTAKELGITGLVPAGWFGLAAPKGTPDAVIEKLHGALVAGLRGADTERKLKDLGWVIVANTPQQARERAQADFTRLGEVARDIELKVQ